MKFFTKFLAVALLLAISIASVSAQAGAGAATTGSYPPDYEIVQKCVDSSGVFIGFYELHLYRTGYTPSDTTIRRWRADGSLMATVPSGTQYLGSCPQSFQGSISIDTTQEFEIKEMCDFNTSSGATTPFIRIFNRRFNPKTGALYSSTVNDIQMNGTVYTVTQTAVDGPCFTRNDNYNTITSTTTGTLNVQMSSWEICNVGMNAGTVNTYTLYPGECRRCSDHTLDGNKKVSGCYGNVGWVATGTEFRIVYQTR